MTEAIGDTEEFYLHFGCEGHSVRAATIVAELRELSYALKSINELIDPLSDIDIYVEALRPGSLRIRLKSIKRVTKRIFKSYPIQAILLPLLLAYVYDLLKGDKPVNIVINTNEVVIKVDKQEIVIPRVVYEKYEKIKDSERVKQPIREMFSVAHADEQVTALGFGEDISEATPRFEIDRSKFQVIAGSKQVLSRTIEQQVELEIIRAILEKSGRRWQFNWNGIRISCPVIDEGFYNRFEAHLYQIAPGDRLIARLRIYQELDPESNTYLNREYSIVQVIDLKKSSALNGKQEKL